MVKNPPDHAGDSGSSSGWGNPLEQKTATHSRILAWKIPRTEESGQLSSVESQRVGNDLVNNSSRAWGETRSVRFSEFPGEAGASGLGTSLWELECYRFPYRMVAQVPVSGPRSWGWTGSRSRVRCYHRDTAFTRSQRG